MIASVYGVRLGPEAPAAYDRVAPRSRRAWRRLGDGGRQTPWRSLAVARPTQPGAAVRFAEQGGGRFVVVTVDGVASEPYSLTMGPASPGVLAVVNADGSRNSEERPAKVGDEVSLLVSGLGRPDMDIDALAMSDDVVPWPVEECRSASQQRTGIRSAPVLWARSRPGETLRQSRSASAS
ncbi:MAG: hypothetical protein R2724_18080 [Bryobacterales bacterium]